MPKFSEKNRLSAPDGGLACSDGGYSPSSPPLVPSLLANGDASVLSSRHFLVYGSIRDPNLALAVVRSFKWVINGHISTVSIQLLGWQTLNGNVYQGPPKGRQGGNVPQGLQL